MISEVLVKFGLVKGIYLFFGIFAFGGVFVTTSLPEVSKNIKLQTFEDAVRFYKSGSVSDDDSQTGLLKKEEENHHVADYSINCNDLPDDGK